MTYADTGSSLTIQLSPEAPDDHALALPTGAIDQQVGST